MTANGGENFMIKPPKDYPSTIDAISSRKALYNSYASFNEHPTAIIGAPYSTVCLLQMVINHYYTTLERSLWKTLPRKRIDAGAPMMRSILQQIQTSSKNEPFE